MWIRQVEVPDELVGAARDGRLVIFVGAGASRDAPSSLPDFKQLVTDIGTQVSSVPTELQLKRPDVFLGDLADMGVNVHALVAKAIDPPGSAPNRLHHAIMSLAAVHPPLRVVTTNYDQHLEIAGRIDHSDVEVFRAPALPIGDDFTGVIHLHGSLGQHPRHLVVTDADFGHAYLREAWAARFLERMFSVYTVLFIGYSHGDVVMQYLARSLGREGRRYVLTDDAGSGAWARLGLTAISYPVVEKSHVALADALERWAELTAWGRLDHRRRIAALVEQEPPSIPEEISYLERALAHPDHVRFFTESATTAAWLQWAATRPEFTLLFTPPPTGDSVAEALSRTLTRWFIDNFACVAEHSPAALRLVRDRPWTVQTWEALVHRLFAQKEPIEDWQVPWLVIALHRAPEGRHHLLDMMLAEDRWRARPALAFTLLAHRTNPIPRAGLDLDSTDGAPRFEVTLTGEEYWLTEAWKNVFTPMLTDHASDLLDLGVRQIRATYRLANLLQPGFDPIGFGRSAIEPHPQDEFRDPHDMLIDAVRDSLEHLLHAEPQHAARQIDLLTSGPEAVLRRLAVHGWRLRTDATADAKVRWVLDQDLVYDLDLQHEVYLLLQDALPSTEPGTREQLLTTADLGPSPEAGATDSPYRRYNLLAWLHQTLPTDPRITAAFNAVQRAHSDYQTREHPDLNMYMTSGFVEDAEPFSPDELHSSITDDPAAALARLREFATADELRLTGPTWTGALAAMRGCVARHPLDGIRVAGHLLIDDDELRGALIRGWSAAQLADADQGLPDQVISLIGTWDLGSIRSQAATLLANGGQADHPTRWHDLASARDLARRLWPQDEVTGNVVSDSDTYLEAINHPAGDLAQFWTKVTAAEWSRQGDRWAGLMPLIETELDRMIDQPGRNGLLARCVLIASLRFYHGAAPEWARARLLPLLSWASDDKKQVAAMWRTFLMHGQYDDSLLRAGLLDSFLTTLEHESDVNDERAMEILGRQMAAIAVRSDDPPTPWLPQLTTKASRMVRLAWTRSVGRQLRGIEASEAHAQWERWIERYWRGRVESIPRPFTHDEASAIAGWVLGLPSVRAETIGLVEQAPAGLERDDRILGALTHLDLRPDASLWARYLAHLLQGTPADEPWMICHHLADIVPALHDGGSREVVSPVIEQALRLGCSAAPDW
ncbi:uncharacterized protein DUF4020 [Georgenia muralis]|uniref:Uncharacterized protein DUF4020 n=1 Tax=Georgenia muralis TaxID=154117 RepID=A0A3N4Z4J9_9MICO|nr:uncharacterized protein DUF4020 [Georgenia muralis]